jgi:two-component system sensor histidine kinase UhpB
VLANLFIYISIGRALRPVDTILKGLADIEQGDYRSRLADLHLPEFTKLAAAFNRMAEVLQHSREKTRFLTNKSLSIQEDERRRFALEMHDEMGQSISAIKAMAVSIQQRADDETVSRSAQTIAEVSDEVYVTVRRMMKQLRPAILDELGLFNTLEQLVEEWNERHPECFCTLVTGGIDAELQDSISISLYRVIQEALTNVAKHAQSTQVSVELNIPETQHEEPRRPQMQAEQIAVRISDNGRGMDLHDKKQGLGLLGIRERVEALEGRFELTSDSGVTLSIHLPFNGGVDESDQSSTG